MTLRRTDVLAALKGSGADGISGETLARELGISRAAVAKHVTALRERGYGIAANVGVGYVLESVPDLPLVDEVVPLLASALWVRIEGKDETGSTNDDAKALARSGTPEGTAVLAARQTAGRGRLGRAWESPSGGVYVSVVLRPDAPLAELTPLPLVVSIGVARGLESLGFSAGLKWPNDVWIGDGKVAGILLETSAEADRAEWVVAGAGINVHRPQEPVPGAAYLDDGPASSGLPSPGLARVAAAVLDGISSAYAEFGVAGFGGLVGEYEEHSVLAGRSVTVRDRSGSMLAQGAVEGIDPYGRLLVEQEGIVAAIAAGDVTLRPPETEAKGA